MIEIVLVYAMGDSESYVYLALSTFDVRPWGHIVLRHQKAQTNLEVELIEI